MVRAAGRGRRHEQHRPPTVSHVRPTRLFLTVWRQLSVALDGRSSPTCTYNPLLHNLAPAWGSREVTSRAGSARDADAGPTTSALQGQREAGGEGVDAGPAAALESRGEGGSPAAPAHSAGSQPREPTSKTQGAEEGYLEEEGTQASAYARVVTPQEARWPRLCETERTGRSAGRGV